MSPKKMRVITRTQIDAMIEEAVKDALGQQKRQWSAQESEHALETTRERLKELERERDEERRRRREAEVAEDNLRTKIRDLENALKLRAKLLENETAAAYERGLAEGRTHTPAAIIPVEPTPKSPPAPAVNVDELMVQMRKTITEEVAQKLEAVAEKKRKISVQEKDIILDSLFKTGLETNHAQMNIRESTGPSVSNALNKLKTFHSGRDALEIKPEAE